MTFVPRQRKPARKAPGVQPPASLLSSTSVTPTASDGQLEAEQVTRSDYSIAHLAIHRPAHPANNDTAQQANNATDQQKTTEQGIKQFQRESEAGREAATDNEDFRRADERQENLTGLPDHIKTGIENLSGYSLNDIRVHYNSSRPADVQALAYTQEAEIHVAPGQEEHLAHEAWHVVQQKQGRVHPTARVNEAAINDDEGLEREADVMAGQAMQMKGKDSSTGIDSRTRSTSGKASRVIQRKVGFEFESVGDSKWRFQGRNSDGEYWTPIKNTKQLLLLTPNTLAGLSADNGNVEAATKPLSTWTQIVQTFSELATLITTLATQGEKVFDATQNAYATPLSGFAQHKIVANGVFKAKPQATIGVAVMNIPALFNAFQIMSKMTGKQESTAEEVIASKTLLYQIQVSAQEAEQFIRDAMKAAGKDFDALADPIPREMVGMLTIILKTLWDAFSNSSSDLTDPKYAFPLMPRTDFRSMLETLEPEASDTLIELWTNQHLSNVINASYPLNAPVFPGGYTGNDGKRYKGPTKQAWFDSIFTGNGPKDLLSPPPGYPAHANTARPEGLGAYEADEQLVLFELRELLGAGPLEVNHWIVLAAGVARMIAVVENDKNLTPK